MIEDAPLYISFGLGVFSISAACLFAWRMYIVRTRIKLESRQNQIKATHEIDEMRAEFERMK